jgi:cadmium resistance protein CadD (predicted permease)
MYHLTSAVMTAIGAFVVTNVDLFVLLVVLFLSSRNGGPRAWQIVVGQYLVFVTLVTVSALVGAGLARVPTEWVGLLGLIPLAIGIHGLVTAARTGESERSAVADSLAAVIGLGASACGDNLSVYVVLFRQQPTADDLVTIAVFLVMLGVWCGVALLLATRKHVVPVLLRVSRWLVPAVLVAIGVVIVVRTGVLVRLLA